VIWRANSVGSVRKVWTPDDLRFALIRAAHLQPARAVANDLLVAASQAATELNGVTATQARLQAGRVLLQAGDRSDGLAVVREAVASADADADALELTSAAGTLFAETGDPDEAVDLALRALQAAGPGGSTNELANLIELSFSLVEKGFFDQALQIADATVESAEAGRQWGGGAFGSRSYTLATLVRQQIFDVQSRIHPAGDPFAPATPPRVPERLPDRPAVEPTSHRPWPALVERRLLWWPRAGYDRIIGQVPELSSVLGGPWREHTAKVEAAMKTAARRTASGSAEQLSLVAADFEAFAQYLERTAADPRLAAVMTAYTADAAVRYAAASWPPRRRHSCWCGSGERYQDCCAKRVPAVVPLYS
jgi:hypothetical protein